MEATPALLVMVESDPCQATPPSPDTLRQVAGVMEAHWRHGKITGPITNDAWRGARLVGAVCGPDVETRIRDLMLASVLEQSPDQELLRVAARIVPGFLATGDGTQSVAALDYLAASESFPRRLALSNMEIQGGRVPLSLDQLRLVVTHFLKLRCPPVPQPPPWTHDAYGSVIAEANRVVAARQRRAALSMQGGLQPDCYPPCIRHYLAKLHEGAPVNHQERFNLVAFLHAGGASEQDIISLFRGLPGYDEGMTTYQVEHITRRRGTDSGYRTMGCRQMRDLEICPDRTCPGTTPLRRYAELLRERPRKVPT